MRQLHVVCHGMATCRARCKSLRERFIRCASKRRERAGAGPHHPGSSGTSGIPDCGCDLRGIVLPDPAQRDTAAELLPPNDAVCLEGSPGPAVAREPATGRKSQVLRCPRLARRRSLPRVPPRAGFNRADAPGQSESIEACLSRVAANIESIGIGTLVPIAVDVSVLLRSPLQGSSRNCRSTSGIPEARPGVESSSQPFAPPIVGGVRRITCWHTPCCPVICFRLPNSR